MNSKSLARPWLILGLAVAAAFALLGFFGREIYRRAPPIPARVVTPDGAVVMTAEDIRSGQQVWQSMGGQQVGTIWGHGAYQAPDWSADWLHREAVALLDGWSVARHGRPYAQLDVEAQAALRARLQRELRTHTYDARTGTLRISADRAAAIATVARHYQALFGSDPALASLRSSYAIQEDPLPDPARRRLITAFFFWTSWSCATERPGSAATYTNNWPHEPLIGNVPTSSNVLWSVLSIVLLLGGVGAMVFWNARRKEDEAPERVPTEDPLQDLRVTPSMRAMGKYALVAVALFGVQVLLGILTAHYTVEGQSFYGLDLGRVLPYAVTRTWHVQAGIFWIATAFLATGLFLAPAVGGREPRFQRLGVNVLFGALVLVVGGSLAGEYLAIHQRLGLTTGFWFGHQGYEYVDLGRFWQILLFVGLLLWLGLMARALLPAFRSRGQDRSLLTVFTASAVCIGLFYGAGLMYGARSHLAVAEYWRWWVVHLWVEGFFEVFATASVAFIFARLGLVRSESAARATLFSATIFLASGIPGTFHHLYFTGTPVSIMAVGASFSALEVVPLVLVGFEAWNTMRMGRAAPWMKSYRLPLLFFAGVAFWNLVGAGIFGFLINPPIALYYMQGLNTTPLHGHAALFGVYGLLALGLLLVVLRQLRPGAWREGWARLGFWGMNIGLGLMIALSLLPVGLAQTAASVEHGLWYARSAEFLQQPLLQNLRWMRMLGDAVFTAGFLSFALFVVGLWTGWSYRVPAPVAVPEGRLEPARPAA